VRRDRALELLREVAAGRTDPSAALDAFAALPTERIDDGAAPFASLDHHRALRQGFPEVVYAAGKTPAQCVAIAERLADRGEGFLATRADADAQQALARRFPTCEVSATGRTVYLAPAHPPSAIPGSVALVTAGTSDLPVAEEAMVTLRALGVGDVPRLTDVGVAGIHRLLDRASELTRCTVCIVIAGMDGALPSVVGGLIRAPVIAVPTSVGYGAAFGGLAPLLSMLNSCAAGVTVTNIDNGFGAAVAAWRILSSAGTVAAGPGARP
jgi:NCAIR mutase (PurE)-related protein